MNKLSLLGSEYKMTNHDVNEMLESFQSFLAMTADDYNRSKFRGAYAYSEQEYDVFNFAWRASRLNTRKKQLEQLESNNG